jgi:hypothetical protein
MLRGASWGTGIICCVMIIGAALVAVLTGLGGLVVGRCWRLPASRSVIPGGGAGVAIAAMPEIAHRGIGLACPGWWIAIRRRFRPADHCGCRS